MKQIKVRIKQKMCLTGGLMFLIAFMFAILTFFDNRFWSIFLFTLTDWIITILPSFYLEIKEVE